MFQSIVFYVRENFSHIFYVIVNFNFKFKLFQLFCSLYLFEDLQQDLISVNCKEQNISINEKKLILQVLHESVIRIKIHNNN